jgi:hypothetical protein
MTKLRKRAHLAGRIISNQAYVVNTKNSVLHEFNETGTFIWKLIEKNRSKADILRELINEFEVSAEKAQRDLDEFLAKLEKNEIIETLG